MTYGEKLKDPRWQKKRLEILNRDEFKCRACQSKTDTLHVHHLKYTDEPWDAADVDLVTLCDVCHDTWHKVYGLPGIDSSVIYLVVSLTNDIEWASIQEWIKEHNGQEVH